MDRRKSVFRNKLAATIHPLGQLLRTARLNKGWNLADFAEKLEENGYRDKSGRTIVGYSGSVTGQWELGKSFPNFTRLSLIASLLEISEEELTQKYQESYFLHQNRKLNKKLE